MAGTGRAVWHDLMTTNAEKSIEFYSKLFGWKTDEFDMGDMGKYQMINVDGENIGGFVPMDPETEIPSTWLAYVTVQDVDDLVKRVPELGGAVSMEPTDIPEVGRFAIVAGPEGAAISPFKGLTEMPEKENPPTSGRFVWDELISSNASASKEFYSSIFEWTPNDVDMGEMGQYTIFKRGEKDAAGLMQMPPEAGMPSLWIPYIGTDDVDGAAGRVEGLGGGIAVPPSDIPGIGRFSVAADITGATFALFKGEGK